MFTRITCSACGFKNRPENKFCTECGQRLEENKLIGPFLSILTTEKSKVVFPIRVGRSTIGRDIGNNIVISDTQISKYHAAIQYNNNEVFIEDLGSTNGIFINGKKVNEIQQLFHGNLIKLGSTILRFEDKKA